MFSAQDGTTANLHNATIPKHPITIFLCESNKPTTPRPLKGRVCELTRLPLRLWPPFANSKQFGLGIEVEDLPAVPVWRLPRGISIPPTQILQHIVCPRMGVFRRNHYEESRTLARTPSLSNGYEEKAMHTHNHWLNHVPGDMVDGTTTSPGTGSRT